MKFPMSPIYDRGYPADSPSVFLRDKIPRFGVLKKGFFDDSSSRTSLFNRGTYRGSFAYKE